MRERYGFDAPLKTTVQTKVFSNIVNTAVDEWQEEKRRKAAAVIQIDVGKLDAIRSDASRTREKLMTEEERGESSEFGVRSSEYGGWNAECGMRNAECGDETSEVGSGKPEADGRGQGTPEVPRGAEDALPLDEVEADVLRALLKGEDCAAVARSGGRMLSVVIDAINEKLYDRFGDTVIYDAGGGPAVYEDYEEELKGRMGA